MSENIGHPYLIKDAYLPKVLHRFLLVSLNIDAILAEVTIRQRRGKLEEMTQGNGLSEAYTATLMRIKEQKGYKSVLGLKALMWVLYSERPLWVEELCHALGVEIGSADLELENIPALRIVLASCLGLITVEVSSSTVRLVHFTLQEYLSDDPTLFHSPHSAIAEVCLTYLNFGFVRDLSPTLYQAPSTTPLLEYASIYWWRHTKREVTESIKILALRLLDKFDQHISIQLLYQYDRNAFWPQWFSRPEILIGFTGLHGAAFFAIEEVVSAVLDMREWDVNAADCAGSTALIWAAMGGHDGVVRRLLEQKEVNPDQSDTKCGWTPLSWATQNGHEGVVKMLLERQDVRLAIPDNVNQTPQSMALSKGHDEVARIKLEQDKAQCAATDPSSPASLQPTALPPDESSVEIQFRSHDLNTHITDSTGQPGPISVVHSEQPRLLDHNDSTPISAASSPPTQSPWWSRPLSIWPLKLLFRPNKTRTHLTSTQPTPLFAFNRRFIISSLILLLALLLYFLPSSLLDILFHKDLPSVRG